MESIRTKDKVFIAVFLPIAVAAAYVYFWRSDASKTIDSLERESDGLVLKADYPSDRMLAERRLKAAEDELVAERKVPMPKTKVVASAGEDVAARELEVLKCFGRERLVVLHGGTAEVKSHRAGDVLKATGVRPDPACRKYRVSGSYSQVAAVLADIVEREMAVVPESVEMVKPDRWVLTLWL